MDKHKNTIIGTIVVVLGLIATSFALSDRYILKATFAEFKTYVVESFRDIRTDHRTNQRETNRKLDLIIERLPNK